jgi:hypothetical protein
MKPRVAGYFKRGYTMSRQARLSHKRNEHPITYWMKELALDKETLQKFLVYAGMHHTGLYAKRTSFYRLPDSANEKEMEKFNNAFREIPATKAKFIKYISEYIPLNYPK